MTIPCTCPTCGHHYRIATELARKSVPCPQCRPEGPGEKPDRRLTLVVIGNWTVEIQGWTGQLDQVIPYMDHIDTQPRVAEKFRAAVRGLIARLEKFV